MSRVSVKCEIAIYEVDGKDTVVPAPKLKIRSHWNNVERVVLEYKGEEITVVARDLLAAIVKSEGVR